MEEEPVPTTLQTWKAAIHSMDAIELHNALGEALEASNTAGTPFPDFCHEGTKAQLIGPGLAFAGCSIASISLVALDANDNGHVDHEIIFTATA